MASNAIATRVVGSRTVVTTAPDVYGQVHPIETPELVAEKLQEFDQLVAKLPSGKETEHALAAKKRCPELLTDQFRLLFLRCDVFNTKLAVKRYCAYWKKRVEIFGDRRAFEPLTVARMHPDKNALQVGVISVVERPEKRNYCFLQPGKMDKTKYSSMSLVRAMWYNIHAAIIDDEVVQKRGLIFIDHAVGAKLSETDYVFTKLMIESFKGCMPVRFSAYHWIDAPAFVSSLWPLAAAFMGKRLRKRVRLHSGSREKVIQEMANVFGFARNELPEELGGSHKVDVVGWLEKRQSEGK